MQKSMFDILGVSRTESVHSDFLSWLLRPNETHGCGVYAVKKLLQSIAKAKLDLGESNRAGFLPDAIKALILQHIEENNKTGNRFSDFADAFPAMSRSAIQKLLRELREGRKIMVVGERKGARWHLYQEV